MTAYGTLKPKSAFKVMCRARGDVPVDLQNEMTRAITNYERDLLYAEDDDKENIVLENYLDNEELLKLFKQGRDYFGLKSDVKGHASGYIISNDNLIDLFGTIMTPSGDICVNLDGDGSKKLGYLKLDWLTVSVVGMTDKVYKEIGISQPSTSELYDLVKDDYLTWQIYEKGLTQCVNQVEQPNTVNKVMKYKPKTVEELCAFVSAIRPGFQSYYKRFENREIFEFGVKSMDTLLQGEHSNSSWLLYQESIMNILQWSGFEPRETYEVLKGIGKKKIEIIMKAKEKFLEKCQKHLLEEGISATESDEKAKSIWGVVSSAANYSFNVSHAYCMAFDSLYIAYAKAHYPLQTYKACIEFWGNKDKKDKVSTIKKEAMLNGINIKDLEFGQDNRKISYDTKTMTIYQSLNGLKSVGKNVANILYEVKGFKGDWKELYQVLINKKLTKTHLTALIKIGYFKSYGNENMLLWYIDNFKETKQLNKNNIAKLYNGHADNFKISYELFERELYNLADKETDKQLKYSDANTVFDFMCNSISFDEPSELQRAYWSISVSGISTLPYSETNCIGVIEKVSWREKTKSYSYLIKDLGQNRNFWFSCKSKIVLKEKSIIFLPKINSYTAKSGFVSMSCDNPVNLDILFNNKSKKGD